MQIRERFSNRWKFSSDRLRHRAANGSARIGEHACHDAREETLPNDRRQPIDWANRFWISIRERMHFRLENLDFATVVGGCRDTSADEHSFSAGKITAHVWGQVEPHQPDSPAIRIEPSAREAAATRAAHWPLDNLAEVALDDRHDSCAQAFCGSAFAPILIPSGEMENQVACRNDPARFHSRRALLTNSGTPGDRTRDLKRSCAAALFAHLLRSDAVAS